MAIETGDSVTFEYTGRLDDGRVFDTSRERVARESGLADARRDGDYEPLTVEVGAGEVVEGLDEALVGMEERDEATVEVPPEKGYGTPSEENVGTYDAEAFADLIGGDPPAEGMYIESPDRGVGEVVHVDDEVVGVDFNHQLAGETLEFEIEIVDVS